MVLKSFEILLPSPFIAVMAATAIKAAIRAYSIRSWPDSSFSKLVRSRDVRFILFLPVGYCVAVLSDFRRMQHAFNRCCDSAAACVVRHPHYVLALATFVARIRHSGGNAKCDQSAIAMKGKFAELKSSRRPVFPVRIFLPIWL